MKGTLFINGKDAYERWGVILGDGSLNSLLLPPPAKAFVENTSRVLHGKQVMAAPQFLDARDVSLIFYIRAGNQEDFGHKLSQLVEEFQKGIIKLRTRFEPNKTYRLLYKSAAQLTQVRGELGKITVKFNEPNPNIRS